MKYVIANWKLHMGTRGGVALVKAVLRTYRGASDLPEIVICPNFLAIGELKKVLSHSRVKLGAQDAFWENEGAHTGSIAPTMLKEAGCEYVILGHSERRGELGETSEMVAKKVRAAIDAGLRVVLCVGVDALGQLEDSLKSVHAKDAERLLVVYEPEGAISSQGRGAEDLPDVLNTLQELRAALDARFGSSGAVPLLYGGSVDGENAYTYLREDAIDGVLVGGASVKIHHMTDIIAAALRTVQAPNL